MRPLPPGHSLTVHSETERVERYWFPGSVPDIRFATDELYAEAARDLLTRAVRDRLQTTEPVGVHLSGGLDSSCVTVLAARERRRQGLPPPAVFSWQPQPDEAASASREYQSIAAVCTQEDLRPQYVPINADDVLTILKKDPTREPIHPTLPVEATILRQAAAQGVRVLMAGWGGDEGISFNGRGYHAELLLRGRWWRLVRESRHFPSPWKSIALQALVLLFPDHQYGSKVLTTRSLRVGPTSRSFIHPDLKRRVKLHSLPSRQASVRSTLFWLWDRGGLAERMESWAAHGAPEGVSYVYPLLDRRVLEFVAGLPRDQFIRGKWRRWQMRIAMEGLLPTSVTWQPDKSEPVRVDHGLTAMYQAFGLARQQLTAAAQSPTRAKFLDMPRLLDHLRPEALARRPGPAHLTRALQFLDF